ncbi:adenylate/guanylate cyclase domain-containing protein [Aestuariivita boseongensis]|uniref:adenylate/guanylate cyclase domain-containing protein n=1 Tax=Aestuariivita boseongensis TaxID=1470562 RepID=UPI000682E4AD|nr:adenylate/guanylate cyclase domain-containing protein [Aestuariivita boseongensis]
MTLHIETWLSDLGLDQYVDAFRENDVDDRVLPLLTGDDLKELGVSLGHRKLILAALADLSPEAADEGAQDHAEPDTKTPPPPVTLTQAATDEPDSAAPAERRHLTVMFADLVGSTELTNRLDPEDMRGLLQRYQDAVAGAVSRYGGYVAKYMGDGVLIFFGWPRAYEDHAVRAIKAGLDIVQRVTGQTAPDGAPLSVRMGIASGEVVVGDAIGENTYEEGAMTGPILNLAARIQSHAPPNCIVMPEVGTEASLKKMFEFVPMGDVSLKGFDTSYALLQVTAERDAESRFHAAHSESSADVMIGRTLERDILRQAWQRAQDGKGEVVLLTGEAGIGKSRTTEAFLSEPSVVEAADIIRLNCSPYLTSSPFHPVTERISQDAGVEPDFDDDRVLKNVRAMLEARPGLDWRQVLPVFAALVAPRSTMARDVLAMSPQEQRDITIQTLINTVKLRAEQRPVILFVEDAHWIDPSTHALIDRFKDVCVDLPLFVLITHRPEWSMEQDEGDAHVQSLRLRRFDADHVSDLVRNITGDEPSPALIDLIIEKTDGIPLFVEELTRTIIASDGQDIDNVPTSLRGALMARLDAMSPHAKQVALAAAVIGREFEPELLAETVGNGQIDIPSSLDELRKAGLIFESGIGRGRYVFRHALIRDTAYQSMLVSTRRQHHARVASAMTRMRAAEVERQPELVAWHLTQAEDWSGAYERWRMASEMALARSASREAMANAQETLQAAQHLGDAACPEMIAAKILVGRGYDSLGRLPECIELLEEALVAARHIKNPELAADAANHFADTAMMAGDWHRDAINYCRAALNDLPEQDERRRTSLLSQLARAYMFTGRLEKSSQYGRKAMELAAKLGDHKAQFSVMMSRFGAPFIARSEEERYNWRDNLEQMHAVAEKLNNIDQGRDRTLSLFVGAEMADRALMDHSLQLLTEISEKDNHLQLYWVQVHARAMVAILEGQFAQAENFANEAVQIGRQTHGEHVEGVFGVQMFTIRREQSRLQEVAPVIKRLMSKNPEDTTWQPGFGLIAAELGFVDAAERILNELAETGFQLPRDAMYSTTLSYLADVCVAVDSREHAATIYDMLLPYEHMTVTAGATTVCSGAAARRLGSLAALMGSWEDCEAMFETALDVDRRMHAPPWLAHSKAAFAAALRRRGRKADLRRAIVLEAEALATARELGMVALTARLEHQAA